MLISSGCLAAIIPGLTLRDTPRAARVRSPADWPTHRPTNRTAPGEGRIEAPYLNDRSDPVAEGFRLRFGCVAALFAGASPLWRGAGRSSADPGLDPLDPRTRRPDGGPLRVVHCPVNTAGVPWTNVQALRSRGVESSLVVFNRYAMHPEADWSLDRHGNLFRRQLTQWRALARLLPSTDVFHFYFGLTLVPKPLQFRILRLFGKKSVFHYLGSDIRGKSPEELAFGKQAGAEIVGSYDAIRWVPEAHVIPPGIDVARIEPTLPVAHVSGR